MTQRVPAGQGLSALQRGILEHIVLALSDQVTQGKRNDRVRWNPAQFYETGASRAAVSNSLRRLEERGLIVRRDLEGQRIDKGKQRTAYVGITGTGLALTMQSVREQALKRLRDKVDWLELSYKEIREGPELGRVEKLQILFDASMSDLKASLRLLELGK